ncbi:MAG: hypothetical protein J5J06_11240 [Phycisphaerae bacterium]|nr:hypothetical protein [Phycisphaerae bacterium]
MRRAATLRIRDDEGGRPECVNRRCVWLPRILMALACAFPSTRVRADQVQVGDQTYTGAEVLSFEEGRIRFRTEAGGYRTAPLEDVQLMLIDHGRGFADFNDAERYAATGEPIKALVRYRRAQRGLPGFWQDILLLRVLRAADRAGRIDEAAEALVRALEQPELQATALALMPRVPQDSVRSRLDDAVRQLTVAIEKSDDDAARAVMELLRFEVLRAADPQAAAKRAVAAAEVFIPESMRTDRLYAMVVDALDVLVGDRGGQEFLPLLDRHIRDCPEGVLPDLLLLKGRVQLRTATTREDAIRASWPYLRVAIHMPDDPRAAEGLLGAAAALEKIGSTDKAIELLTRCVENENATSQVRARAEQIRARLQGSTSRGKANG